MFRAFISLPVSYLTANETHSTVERPYSDTAAINTIKIHEQSLDGSFTLYAGSLWLIIMIS